MTKLLPIPGRQPSETDRNRLRELKAAYFDRGGVPLIEADFDEVIKQLGENNKSKSFSLGLYVAIVRQFAFLHAEVAATAHHHIDRTNELKQNLSNRIEARWSKLEARVLALEVQGPMPATSVGETLGPRKTKTIMARRDADGNLVAHVIEEPNDSFDAQISELVERVRMLEEKPSVQYRGVFECAISYAPGDLTTHDGSVWHCNTPTQGVVPGFDKTTWTLAVKRGRDGSR